MELGPLEEKPETMGAGDDLLKDVSLGKICTLVKLHSFIQIKVLMKHREIKTRYTNDGVSTWVVEAI